MVFIFKSTHEYVSYFVMNLYKNVYNIITISLTKYRIGEQHKNFQNLKIHI